jgi:hypothetical protein
LEPKNVSTSSKLLKERRSSSPAGTANALDYNDLHFTFWAQARLRAVVRGGSPTCFRTRTMPPHG